MQNSDRTNASSQMHFETGELIKTLDDAIAAYQLMIQEHSLRIARQRQQNQQASTVQARATATATQSDQTPSSDFFIRKAA